MMMKKTLLLTAALALLTGLPLAAQQPATVEGMGAIPHSGGVAFRVWAPNADSVHVAGAFNNWSTTANRLAAESGGIWSVNVAGAREGQEYKYVIRRGTQTLWRPDPRATRITHPNRNGVIGQLDYQWQPTDYTIPALNDLVIYEMHIGTYNAPGGPPGRFNDAIARLDHLADLGVNMIQLMPVSEFAGDFSWGYNPSHLFALESAYGHPRDFKRFVNEANRRGIGVGVDVVHNHYGPSDLDLWNFDGASLGHGGIYFYPDSRANTDWGDTRPDFRQSEVRRFIRDNVFFWIEEYRLDLLRWDSTSNIWATSNGGGTFLQEGADMLAAINQEMKARYPGKILIAEDFHGGGWVTTPTFSGGLGFDSQWSGTFVHPLRAAITATSDANRSMWAVRDAINFRYNNAPFQRVVYTESHDEVANGRSRTPDEITPQDPGSWFARKRSTLGALITFTTPGVPMIFQGQEFLEDGWFRDTVPLDWSKTVTYSGILDLYKDMIALRRNFHGNTGGLRGGNVNVYHVNNTAKVLAFHRWGSGGVDDDVIVVANFSNTTFENYNIGFPHGGDWHVLLNTDLEKYSPDYDGFGLEVITTTGQGMDGLNHRGNVPLPPYSGLILSRTPMPVLGSGSGPVMWLLQ